ncbi:protein phosphatase Slingshot homolog 1 [Pristis pectinata]|uniref:protein phosphatase Slingshot homolog 1 n=1 Tax=Pristis pectinata TaxID=685728 RepID=UPI00223C94CE|nr:protein phosphatase Slingshot homolog 1 [Pristis pectinata]
MALVTVQRSPTPSASSSPSVSEGCGDCGKGAEEVYQDAAWIRGYELQGKEVGSDDDHRLQQSLSDSFFTVKGAALFLQQGSSSQVSRCHHHHKYAGDLQLHLQVMINHLRPEDRIKLAVRLESMSADRIRYMVVVYTNGHQDTEENILLGIDFASKESNTCTIGMILPLWSDTKIHLDGDGGFSVSTADRILIFKPVSVQAMWSALQILHKSCEIARRYNYYPSGIALTWASYYESCINSEQSCINEWNTMQDLQSMRADSPPMFVDKPTESELTERLIRNKLRHIMMSKDLENVTSKEIRNELEQQMNCNLKEYKGFIDNEMLIILGQMDKASLIFDHLYLGSEWNASNLEELQATGVGYILNVTREIDNFFPGLFCYHNIRVFDEDSTDLLAYWNDTYNFITKAKKNQSKCLVHCKMGVSRSASTVIAYAMKEYRWSLEKAYKHVKEKRSVAQPNAGFMKQLAEYEGILDASKHRHNSLWRRNSESDLQETVRDPLFKSTRIPTQHDLSSGNKGIQHRYGKQKYNGTEPSQNSIAANKNKSEPNNSNCYLRCLSDPIVDSAYVKQQRELDQVRVDDVERDAIRMNNIDFRRTAGFCDTGEFVSSQFQDTYDCEDRVLSQQGNTYLMFTAVAESEEENENTMGFSVYIEDDRIALNEPNTESDIETDSHLTNMQEPGMTVTVENQLDKDNVNNNNNTTTTFIKEYEDVTTNETPNSVKPLNKFTLDCSDSINKLACEQFTDHSKNLYPAQKCGTSTKDMQQIETHTSGFLSNVDSVVSTMDILNGIPNEAKLCHVTESPVCSSISDAIYAIATMQFHGTAEADVVLRAMCEEQREQQETIEAYHSCKNELDEFQAESFALDMMASQSVLKQLPVISPCSHDYQKTFLIDSNVPFIHTGSKAEKQAEYELHMLKSNDLPLGNEQDDIAEITENSKFVFTMPSSRQSIEDNHGNETMNSKPMKDLRKLMCNQAKETSKVQSYLMQHQESILQLQKAGLVRKHTKELERLAFLRSPNKQVQRNNSQNREGVFAQSDSLDINMHESVVDVQDQAQDCENVEDNVLPETNRDGFNFMAGIYQKTSTPYISNRSSGFLTKERLQQIYATLLSSTHSSSLTRSSSSDSLHSIQGQPGLVELRTQEIEARMHQTGLTICSEMKRSHSLAKLESLNLASEVLSTREKDVETLIRSSHAKQTESCFLPSFAEKMRWERNLCEETDMQREQVFIMKPLNKAIKTSSSVLEHKALALADIQCTYQFEHSSEFSLSKYSVADPEVTQQCMDFISIPSFGLGQYHTQSDNELYSLASHEQYVRTHSMRKLRKTCEKSRSSNSFYNTM